MYELPKLRGDEVAKYLRKSRTDDPLLSVEEVLAKHEQMIDEWMARNMSGETVSEENAFREVVSGETIASRPRMVEMLRMVESPRIKAIVCVEPSRLSRGDLQDIGYLVKILRYTNTIVITMNYTYDLNDQRDREQFERELMRGNDFLEYQKMILGAGRQLALQSGWFIASHAPYGYKKISVKEGRKTYHTLEIDQEKAPAVRMAFELYASGVGTTSIAEKLDEAGFKPKQRKKWSGDAVGFMLRNQHYIGKVVWGRRKNQYKVEGGEVVLSRPTSNDNLVYEGRHTAIISQDLWDVVQAKRGQIPKHNRTKELTNPIAGLLICGVCGRTMVRRSGHTAYPQHVCEDQKICKMASAGEKLLVPEIEKVLRESIEDFRVLSKKKDDGRQELHRQNIERMHKRLLELKELEIKQWDEKIKGKIPDAIFDRLNESVLIEIADTEQAIKTAKSSMPVPIDYKEREVTFTAALKALQDSNAPASEKNELLKACIERITYRRERYGDNPAKKDIGEIELHFDLRI